MAFIVDHIGTEAIVQLLMTMIDCETFLETLSNTFSRQNLHSIDVNRYWSHELIPLLSQKISISSSVSEEDLLGIGELVDSITRKHPTSHLLLEFQREVFIKELLKNALYEMNERSHEYLTLLIKIVKTCFNTRDYVRKDIPPVILHIVQEEEEEKEEETVVDEEEVKKEAKPLQVQKMAGKWVFMCVCRGCIHCCIRDQDCYHLLLLQLQG